MFTEGRTMSLTFQWTFIAHGISHIKFEWDESDKQESGARRN